MGLLSAAVPRCLLAFSLLSVPVLLAPRTALAQGVAIETATDAQKKEAQTHYDRGAKAFDQKKHEDAFNAFAASYGVVKSPNAHMMMARSLMALGRYPRAYNELWLTEQESGSNPKYATTLERSKELRAEAAQKVAVVSIKLVGEKSGPVRVTVNNEIAPVERPYALEPGKVTVKAFVNDQQTDVKELDLPAGKEQAVELKVGETRAIPGPAPTPPVGPTAPPAQPQQPPPVVPPKEDPPASPAATGLLVGGTVVSLLGLGGMAVGAGFYFAAKEEHDFFSDTAESGCRRQGEQIICPETYAERLDDAEENQKFAAISVGVGGAVTAIGVGMLIAGGVLVGAPKDQQDASTTVRVGFGPTSLWIEGEY